MFIPAYLSSVRHPVFNSPGQPGKYIIVATHVRRNFCRNFKFVANVEIKPTFRTNQLREGMSHASIIHDENTKENHGSIVFLHQFFTSFCGVDHDKF